MPLIATFGPAAHGLAAMTAKQLVKACRHPVCRHPAHVQQVPQETATHKHQAAGRRAGPVCRPNVQGLEVACGRQMLAGDEQCAHAESSPSSVSSLVTEPAGESGLKRT